MQRCVLEPERPDSYTGGFSCQPFSQMRSGRQSRTRVPPEQHPLFKNAVLQVKYLRKVQPRTALLENTSGIAHESSYGGTVMSGIDWLREQLQDLYHIEFVDVDLLPWLFMRRRRCWIFCIHVDVGSAEVGREACRLTTVIQQRRALHPPVHIAEFMFAPESPEWLSQVRSGLAGSLAPVGGEVVDAAWHRQVTEQRERWHQSGFNGHDSHPLVHAALRGLSTRPRERAVLEVHLIQACWDMGGSPKNPEDIALAKKVLVRDCSQNVRGIQGAACTKRDLHGNTTSLACSSASRAHGCTATSGIVKYCRRRFCVRWVGKPRAIQLIATALRRTICRIWWESAKLSQTWERQSWHSSSVAASVCLVCGRSNLGMYVHRRWPRGFTGLHQRRRIGTCTRLYGGLVDSQASTSARSIY